MVFTNRIRRFYIVYKTNFGCERYLLLLPSKLRKILVMFRTTNHRLFVEIGRRGIVERSKRIVICVVVTKVVTNSMLY